MSSPGDARPLPRGRRLAVDVGAVRIGVAVSDSDGLLATPVETVLRDTTPAHGTKPGGAKARDTTAGDATTVRSDLARIAELAEERDVVVVYVGLPVRLQGDEGPAAASARDYARELAERMPGIDVRLVDERLSTAAATRGLRASGVSSRKGRKVIDQAAAVMILDGALDAERASGRRAGQPLDGPGSPSPAQEAQP